MIIYIIAEFHAKKYKRFGQSRKVMQVNIENDIAKEIVDTAFKLHLQYGPGLFESVYEELMYFELTKRSLSVSKQVPIPLIHETIKLDAGFRADLIIENKVLIEINLLKPLHPFIKNKY